jgi:hypothetical protein
MAKIKRYYQLHPEGGCDKLTNMKTKQLNPGWSNGNLLADIQAGDIVRFKGDGTSYIAQNRKAQRTDSDHFWFKAEGATGFTIPRNLLSTMSVESWERPEPKHRYKITTTVATTKESYCDHNDQAELVASLASDGTVLSFEVVDLGEVGDDGKIKKD